MAAWAQILKFTCTRAKFKKHESVNFKILRQARRAIKLCNSTAKFRNYLSHSLLCPDGQTFKFDIALLSLRAVLARIDQTNR